MGFYDFLNKEKIHILHDLHHTKNLAKFFAQENHY